MIEDFLDWFTDVAPLIALALLCAAGLLGGAIVCAALWRIFLWVLL